MLDIENLSVEYYRRGQRVAAVDQVSLSIKEGEAVGLVGESGSGKSTIALAVLRLIGAHEGCITGGRILLDGVNLLSLSEPAMREQMEEVYIAHSMPRKAGDLEQALAKVQLDPGRVLNAYPHQLSGGQRQRAMIAMALLGNPKCILADEPTTALDVLVQKEILDLLARLQREMGCGMLLISHNLAIVGQYTQRIAVMKEGTLVEQGTPAQIFKGAQHPYTRQLIAALNP